MKSVTLSIAAIVLLAAPTFAERVEHNGCYADWTDSSLTIGNALLDLEEANVTVLGGKGSASYENGELITTIPDTLQYLFIRVTEK